MAKKSRLTPKQAKFLAHYLETSNASAAYRHAYNSKGSEASINTCAWELLRHPEIARRVEDAKRRLIEKAETSLERLIREAAAVALFDPLDLFDGEGQLKPLQDIPELARRAIAGIEVTSIRAGGEGEVGRVTKVRLSPKVSALELLGKWLGANVERREDVTQRGSTFVVKLED